MLPKKMLCYVDLLYRLCDRFFFRHKETKQQIVDFIYVKMPEETDNELLAIMIVVLQDLTKMKFGLKEDSNSGIISGNVTTSCK